MRLAVLLFLVGCTGGSTADTPDAMTYAYTVGTTQVSGSPDGVTGRVDGEPIDPLTTVFPNAEAAVGATFTVESIYDGVVLDRVTAHPGTCVAECDNPEPVGNESAFYGIKPGGRLHLQYESCGGCNIDHFYPSECGVFGPNALAPCAGDEKCGVLTVHTAPLLHYRDCVPNGAVAVGDACTTGAAGLDTGYDDCQADATCIDNVCRAFCDETHPCETGTCTYDRDLPSEGTALGYCG